MLASDATWKRPPLIVTETCSHWAPAVVAKSSTNSGDSRFIGNLRR